MMRTSCSIEMKKRFASRFAHSASVFAGGTSGGRAAVVSSSPPPPQPARSAVANSSASSPSVSRRRRPERTGGLCPSVRLRLAARSLGTTSEGVGGRKALTCSPAARAAAVRAGRGRSRRRGTSRPGAPPRRSTTDRRSGAHPPTGRRRAPSRRAAGGSSAPARRLPRAAARAPRASVPGRAPGSRAAPPARGRRRPRARSPRGRYGPRRAGRGPWPLRAVRVHTCGERPARLLLALALQRREVELADCVFDQASLVGVVERLPRHLLGCDEREVGHLGSDLLERARRFRFDLLAGVLEPALPILLGLLADAFPHRVRDAAGLAEDVLRLATSTGAELAMLLEQPACLLAGPVGLLERAANPFPPLVDRLLDRSEREPPQDVEGDPEADERPDHEAGDDLDERICCQQVHHVTVLDA